LEKQYVTNMNDSMPVNVNKPKFIGDLHFFKVKFSLNTLAMSVNIQYITLNYLPC